MILTGINLGLYGFDIENFNLLYLLKEIVRTDINQIRLSSIEPMFFNDEMIDFIASQKRYALISIFLFRAVLIVYLQK